jgi:hypothetical protein
VCPCPAGALRDSQSPVIMCKSASEAQPKNQAVEPDRCSHHQPNRCTDVCISQRRYCCLQEFYNNALKRTGKDRVKWDPFKVCCCFRAVMAGVRTRPGTAVLPLAGWPGPVSRAARAFRVTRRLCWRLLCTPLSITPSAPSQAQHLCLPLTPSSLDLSSMVT